MRQHAIFPKPAKVSSLPSTTPLEGSGRAVHERERPGVGWNPLSLAEGEGAGGVEGKDGETSKMMRSASVAKGLFIATHDSAQIFPHRQAAIKSLTMQTPSHVGGGRGWETIK